MQQKDSIDRDGLWGALIVQTPAIAVIYYGYLLRQIKIIWQGLKKEKITLYAMILLTGIGFISALSSPDFGKSLPNILVWPLFLGVFALGRWGIKNPKAFIKGLVYGAGFLSLVILIAKFFHLNIWLGNIPILTNFKYISSRGNVLGMADNGLAAMIEVGVLGGLSLFLITDKEDKKKGVLYLAIALVTILAIFNTFSRGSIVGISGATVVLLILANKYWRGYWRPLLALFLVLLLIVAVWPGVQNRIKSIFDIKEDRSNTGRFSIWTVSLRMFKEHWLIGAGPGLYGSLYSSYVVEGDSVTACRSPHSFYLYVLTGWGLLGFVVFFGWLFYELILPIINDYNIWRIIPMVMALSFFIHVVFNDLFIFHVPLLIGLVGRDDL